MKFLKQLPLTCVLALALAACTGPTPTVAPQPTTSGTVAANTELPPGYPVDSTQTGPNGAYPAAATPTAAVIEATQVEATAASSDTPAGVPATETTVADTPVPATPVPAATAATAFITYQDDGTTFAIVPSQTTIKVGTKVTFLIKSTSGSFHQPFSFNPPGFFPEAPGELGDGTSYSFTFTQAGTIVISCGYHEALMKANLTIEP